VTGKHRRIIILLPWLALPLIAGSYAALWPRLPAELAVQFDSSGAATNSLSRTYSLLLDSAILLFVLGRFTFKLWDADRRDTRAVVATYYLAVVFVTSVFLAILKFNL
jgi:hypothetical protein